MSAEKNCGEAGQPEDVDEGVSVSVEEQHKALTISAQVLESRRVLSWEFKRLYLQSQREVRLKKQSAMIQIDTKDFLVRVCPFFVVFCILVVGIRIVPLDRYDLFE